MSAPLPIVLSHCTVDLGRRRVVRGERQLRLSTREAELLGYLVARPGIDVSREELYREVWGYARSAASRTLDVTVRRLREKVEAQAAEPHHIRTVRGVGYRFEPLPAGSSPALDDSVVSAPLSPLLGRDEDCTALESALDRGAALLSVLGPPGVGKSRIAAELASRRPGLVVLDDPEESLVQAVLATAGGNPVVATALRPFRLRGEHRYVLGPLAAPDGTRLIEVQLEYLRIPGLSARRSALSDLAVALGGNPALLESAGRHLGQRASSVGLESALRELAVDQWLEQSVLDCDGPFLPALEATWRALGPGARQILGRVASRSADFLTLDDVIGVGLGSSDALVAGHTEGPDDLQELVDHSALVPVERSGERCFLLPGPMCSYVLSRIAASTEEASHS